jgi:hypothetical protein
MNITRRGRPPKDSKPRTVQRPLRMEPADDAAIRASKEKNGDSSLNDATLRLIRAGIEAERNA